jgi:hypothetical protein
MNPLHLSISNECYTPAAIAEAARSVMGGIYLDPASCAIANEVVKAETYFSKECDGLSAKWIAPSVFLNPPGGKIKNRSSVALWWDKLLQEYESGHVGQAIFLAFNDCLVHQRSSVHKFPICWIDETATAECVKGGRICFDQIVDGKRIMQRSPTHGNFIVYLPPKVSSKDGAQLAIDSVGRFIEYFSQFGTVD